MSKWKYFILKWCYSTGFGVFGKQETTNSLNNAIEELADDLESQQVRDIMGISEFGRKAKTFDITVRNWIENLYFVRGGVWTEYSLEILERNCESKSHSYSNIIKKNWWK